MFTVVRIFLLINIIVFFTLIVLGIRKQGNKSKLKSKQKKHILYILGYVMLIIATLTNLYILFAIAIIY